MALHPGAIADPTVQGRWDAVFPLPNVAIHAHLLPNGKVLFWGRRDAATDSLDVHECTPWIWDPTDADPSFTQTPQPAFRDGTKVNLFCSGHTFLPDGRLLVVGGHYLDSVGLNQACIYDYATNTWTATAEINHGRWYPTAITLPSGDAAVFSGSIAIEKIMNRTPQVWHNDAWRQLSDFDGASPLYPRMHIAPDGRIFVTGPLPRSYFLDADGTGDWTPMGDEVDGSRSAGLRDYAPSVMYDTGKFIYIGGGNDKDTHTPTNIAEIIDLNLEEPHWRLTAPMNFDRRQHNAVVLPDGTVLVVGGTRGGGGPQGGFNDLSIGEPVHTAELWNPVTKEWTILSDEQVDRCYHSIALLLPDGRVLSAGGGEYRPRLFPLNENDPKDSHRDAQIFSPPYLFKGPRPLILQAPDVVTYGDVFAVKTNMPDRIAKVSLIRLPSVTHSFDHNQGVFFPQFDKFADSVQVSAPINNSICPPGHYMMFLLNEQMIPSIAKIVRVKSQAGIAVAHALRPSKAIIPLDEVMAATERDCERAEQKGTHVVVGLTPTCPYGLSACWAGAYDALSKLQGVGFIDPVPDAENSTAEIYLKSHDVPDISLWPSQFEKSAQGSYGFRGVEITIVGAVQSRDGQLVFSAADISKPVMLAPIVSNNVVQWDAEQRAPKPLSQSELSSYENLAQKLRDLEPARNRFRITGPLLQTERGLVLEVRSFERLQ